MFDPPICLLITWESRNWRKLKKAMDLCKDYGLKDLSKKLFIGNVTKNEMPKLQQKLRVIFVGKSDRLFVVMLCKSCLETSYLPASALTYIVEPLKYEIV